MLGEFGENPISVVAFVQSRLAIAMWFLAIPLGLLLDRHRPADAGRYLA